MTIIALLPVALFGFGLLIGLFSGVWALTVLTRPDVKLAFAAESLKQKPGENRQREAASEKRAGPERYHPWQLASIGPKRKDGACKPLHWAAVRCNAAGLPTAVGASPGPGIRRR